MRHGHEVRNYCVRKRLKQDGDREANDLGVIMRATTVPRKTIRAVAIPPLKYREKRDYRE